MVHSCNGHKDNNNRMSDKTNDWKLLFQIMPKPEMAAVDKIISNFKENSYMKIIKSRNGFK